jgi:hypothetical protein
MCRDCFVTIVAMERRMCSIHSHCEINGEALLALLKSVYNGRRFSAVRMRLCGNARIGT